MNKSYFILLVLIANCASAQTLLSKIDSLGTQLSGNQVGVSILAAKEDSILYDGQFGFAALELQVPLAKKHLFRIGSITKEFTAVSILKLHQEGKLSVYDPVSDYLQDYPDGDSITILQLLNHTSGISNYTGLKKWTSEDRKRDFTVDQLIDYFKDEAIEFAPGTKWKYNDSGYVLLGKIIEEVSGMSYASFVSAELSDKLGLVNTRYDDSAELISNRAKGYQMNNGVLENAAYLSTTQPYAAGGILSTTEDVLEMEQTNFQWQFHY